MAPHDSLDPRVERSRQQVLEATGELLREVGYGALSIEAVASRSGVAKSTIYRHWPGKVQLVADAFVEAKRNDLETLPPPGPVRDRVVAVLLDLLAAMSGTETSLVCLLPAAIDAAERCPDIGKLVGRTMDEGATPLARVLDDAMASGELRPDVDVGVLVDALAGPILLRRLFHRDPIRPEDVPALVDQLLPVAEPTPSPDHGPLTAGGRPRAR